MSADMMVEHAELFAWHYCAGLLLGEYPPIDSIPLEVEEERLQDLIAAIIGVHAATDVWPVDVVHVAEVLDRRGVFAPAGGFDFLTGLIEDWSHRESTAVRLTTLTLVAREAEHRDREVGALEHRAEDLLRELEDAKADAKAAFNLLPMGAE